MLKHPVFGNGMFDIVNVAGSGDEEEKAEEALSKVRKAIKSAGDNYTITLSCGKLTTGVTVKEWTAVFMLAGSFSTYAANYLQTIFRVQSPCNENGKIKNTAYYWHFLQFIFQEIHLYLFLCRILQNHGTIRNCTRNTDCQKTKLPL